MAKKGKNQLVLISAADSEVEAYSFIREQLRELGWSVKDPCRMTGGHVWTQNQCLAEPAIKAALGTARPENIVKLSETKLWVIEAKAKQALLQTAIDEAEKDYANLIQAEGTYSVPLITGIAGNDTTGYEVRTLLKVKNKYQPVKINDVVATGLLDVATVQRLLDSGNPNLADFVVNEKLFLKTAERVNRTLHQGGINKNDRAQVMAALLLALLEGTPVNVDGDLLVLISDINTRTQSILGKHGKKEFQPFVKIEPPTSDENHVKYKTAIVRTIQALKNLSIKSAMNSGTDVLGKFYEVFLRYGNGAKEIGIVLTPRHVTRFAVETVGVAANDIVLDPACGTGGFLVAAFDYVRRTTKPSQLDKFKLNGLFGIEQESKVAALAIVNMIFRGDGKNNITEASAFKKFLHRAVSKDGIATAAYSLKEPDKGREPVTKVFMNPPFALKGSEHEWEFVKSAIKSVEDGGSIFAIVPMSVVTEGGKTGAWRKTILNHHTLQAVLSFPEELFYPVSNQTVGLFLEKGKPHPKGQPVFWGRIANDGFRKSKGKRLEITPPQPTDLDRIRPKLQSFLRDPTQPVDSIPEFMCAKPVDPTDPIVEFAPEAYLESHEPGSAELSARLDRQVRENVGAFVDLDLRLTLSGRPSIIESSRVAGPAPTARPFPKLGKVSPVELGSLFILTAGDFHSLADEAAGKIPVATCADLGNGVAGTYEIDSEYLYGDALTIAFNGSPLTTKMHPYEFAAKDDVAIAIPKETMTPECMLFIQAQLNAERWRFSYYRKCFKAKLGRTTLELPVKKDGSIDFGYMNAAVQAQPYWWFLAPRLSKWSPSLSPNAREAIEAAIKASVAKAEKAAQG